MSKVERFPATPATQFLKANKVAFSGFLYPYVAQGGTASSASALGVDEHRVVKTLVMEDEKALPLIVLMHGDCTVSTKELARQVPCKAVSPCKPDIAQKHSGYLVGGTSPFGTKKTMPIFVEASILDLDSIWINGGRRGFLVSICPSYLLSVLKAVPVHVALV